MPAALLIDIKDSRKYDPDCRSEIQDYFVRLTDYMNWVFAPSLCKELRFSAGDEIQGLFDGIGAAYTCLRWFSRLAAPIKIHAGIGMGELSTWKSDRRRDFDTNYQYGPVYYNARAAIDKAKKETDYMALIVSKSAMDPCWNAMMNAGFQLIENNTANQNELAILLEFLCPIGKEFMKSKKSYSETEMHFKELYELLSQTFNDSHDLKELHGLMLLKNKLFVTLKSSKQSTKTSFPDSIPDEYLGVIKKMREYANRPGDIFYIRSHPYGTASVIAKLTNTNKTGKIRRPNTQSADIALKASNVYAERAIALALVEETREPASRKVE